MIDIKESFSLFEEFSNVSSERKKSYIHYNSFTNFFKNFALLKTQESKETVSHLLLEYTMYIQANFEGLNNTLGMDMVSKYLMPIGKIYKDQLDFKEILKQKLGIIFSVIIDVLLYIFGIENFFKIPIPLVTIGTAFYYIVFLNPIIKKGKVFGIFW